MHEPKKPYCGPAANRKTMLTYLQIIAGIWIIFMAFLYIPALLVRAPLSGDRPGMPRDRSSSR